MTNRRNDGDQLGPACPSCGSSNTVATFQHFSERLFFCADCEHSWATTPNGKTTALPAAKRRS